MSYEITWEARGVYWKYFGNVSSVEVLKSNEDIYGDERFDTLRYQIADFSNVEAFDADERAIRKVAAMDRIAARSNSQILVALVTDTEHVVQVLKLYEVETANSPWSVGIFRSLEDARRWINIAVGANNSEV